MTKAKGPALVEETKELFGITVTKKFNIYNKKNTAVFSADIINENDILGVPDIIYDVIQNREVGISVSYDTQYCYTGFNSEFKEMSNCRTSCKDYINDWIYGRVHNNKFEEEFYNGAFFWICRNGRHGSEFDTATVRANAAIKQFLTEIRYQNPDGMRMICVSRKQSGVMYHIERRLLTMPAVISGIMMLMRNSYMYNGESIPTYLTMYRAGSRSNNETSGYDKVILFIKLFDEKNNIQEIYPDDPKVGWAEDIGNRHGAHSIFGIRDFISYGWIESYKKFNIDRQAALLVKK